jgi:histidyl-tRNA synthetase
MSDDTTKKPSTEPYKGVRDFYPEDMAIQRYIFDTWAKTAELFGFERYDASILEPADLYRAKSSDEIVNDQTYTFIDRGEREVTLRPEMTPTVARMVAGKRRELTFPLRWYSIPNLFRYERTQRGRLREHWQLNCDIFGSYNENADVEIILLASHILKGFGAKDSDFEIHINDRKTLFAEIHSKIKDPSREADALRLLDSKAKMSAEEFSAKEAELFNSPLSFSAEGNEAVGSVLTHLSKLGVTNAVYDPTIVRGFTYYTGTVFEIFDTNPENRRSLLGGGRYDNLAGLFGGDPIPAIGFGMGDVTMRDFLETHGLLEKMPASYNSAPTVMVVTSDESYIDVALTYAQKLREAGVRTSVNLGTKKMGDQIKAADKVGARYILPVGSEEVATGVFKAKKLADGVEVIGTLDVIAKAVK